MPSRRFCRRLRQSIGQRLRAASLRGYVLMAFACAGGTAFAHTDATGERTQDVSAQKTLTVLAQVAPVGPATRHAIPRTRASSIAGADVRTVLGERLGTIEDLVVDPARGHVLYAVMSVHGVLGDYTDRYFPVPWTALHASGDYYVLNIDAARLKEAPSFDAARWPELTSQPWQMSVYQYYNQRPLLNDAPR